MEFIDSLMLLFKYVFLGFVQGLTEPLPISSSGHVLLMRHFLNVEIKGLSFEIIVNTGSLIAIIVIYRKDLYQLTKSTIQFLLQPKSRPDVRSEFNFVLYLIIATIPAGVIGLFFGDFISDRFSTIRTVGITLLFTGVALWIIRNLRGNKGDFDLSIKEALIIGLAQTVALIPGISRSGATLVAAMLLGLKRQTALKFSFLLYIPISLGVAALSITDIMNDPFFNDLMIPYIVAFIAAILTSYFALRWFMDIMKRGKLLYFSFYCFIVGTIVTILSFTFIG